MHDLGPNRRNLFAGFRGIGSPLQLHLPMVAYQGLVVLEGRQGFDYGREPRHRPSSDGPRPPLPSRRAMLLPPSDGKIGEGPAAPADRDASPAHRPSYSAGDGRIDPCGAVGPIAGSVTLRRFFNPSTLKPLQGKAPSTRSWCVGIGRPARGPATQDRRAGKLRDYEYV